MSTVSKKILPSTCFQFLGAHLSTQYRHAQSKFHTSQARISFASSLPKEPSLHQITRAHETAGTLAFQCCLLSLVITIEQLSPLFTLSN